MLTLRNVISDAARAVDEDAWGHDGATLWVLDGATGVADERCTPGPTDAAWLAQWASAWLGRAAAADRPAAAGEDVIGDWLARLETDLGRAFDDLGPAPAGGDVALPSCCLAVARHDAVTGVIEVGCIGDVTVLAVTPDGILRRATDTAAQPFGARTLRSWEAARAAGGDPAQWWQAARRTILGNRAHVNRPGGYWVVHPRRPWAHQACRFRFPAPPGTRIVMLSDGMYRLVDLFHHIDDHALVERAFDEGARLLATLRGLESADAGCERHARVKPGDDATLVAAEVSR